jgi:hypothetical protein
MNEGTTSEVGYNKLNSFSVEDPAQRPLTFNIFILKFTLKHLKYSYMFRSLDHHQGASLFLAKVVL